MVCTNAKPVFILVATFKNGMRYLHKARALSYVTGTVFSDLGLHGKLVLGLKLDTVNEVVLK